MISRNMIFLMCLFLSSVVSAQSDDLNDEWFVCLIKPDAVVDVGFPVWGVVEYVAVERGDIVEEGQLVAELQSGVEKTTIKINQARLEFEERNRDRTQELSQDGHISAFDVDQSNTQTELAFLELERSQETLDLRKIRSPFTGVVAERMVSAGEYVQEQPILQLVKINPLKVEVVLPVNYFGQIDIDDSATIRPEYPVTDEYMAAVTIVDRVIDAASGTMGITLELANPDNRLAAGLKCELKFDK